EALEQGCMGNEIWVLDVAADTPTWSRWLIQANSLHKLELGNKLYMAVVRPDSIFVLDELAVQDEHSVSGQTDHRPISWRIETNTQGANRAHAAWAHLQQASITVGNFMGKMRYGIRGQDRHGRVVDVSKELSDPREVDLTARPLPWDLQDHLLIKRDLMEWVFYAESVEDEPSYGRINLVQYRFTPVSVNVGYEYGSVETFEYGRGQ